MGRYRFYPVLSVFLILFLSSCAHTYIYNGMTYHSPEAGLEAQRANFQQIHSEIQAAETRCGGSAAVIIPNFETCVALGVTRTGSPPQELVDYVARIMVGELRGIAISLEKRSIFGRVIIVEDAFPLPASKKMKAEHDVVIYLDMVSPTQIQWFLTAAPEYKDVAVHADNSKPVGYPRVKSWLDDIEKKLDLVRYKPRQVQ